MSGKLTLTLSRPASPALQRVLAATGATPPAAAPAPIPAPGPKAVAPKAVASGKAVAPGQKPATPAPKAAAPKRAAPPKAPKPERPPPFVHQPADDETREHNQRLEAEWEAAHPPAPPAPEQPPAFVHQPADPETLAWNRRLEAEWEATPKPIEPPAGVIQTTAAIEAALRSVCPAAFCHPPKPLAIGIHHGLAGLLSDQFEQIQVHRFLRSWTRQSAYQATLIEVAARVDLIGQQVGEVNAPEVRIRLGGGNKKLEIQHSEEVREEAPNEEQDASL